MADRVRLVALWGRRTSKGLDMIVKRFIAALGLAGLFMVGMAASPLPASAQPACGPWNNWCEPQCGEWNAYCVGEIIEGLLFQPDEPRGYGYDRYRPGPRAYGRGYGNGRPRLESRRRLA